MKRDRVIYTLMSAALLCGTYSVQAQNELRTTKIIEARSHKDADDKIQIISTTGDVFVLPKEDISTSVYIDRENNEVKIEANGEEIVTKNLDQDVVVLNINGVTVLTRSSKDDSTFGSEVSDAQSTTSSSNSRAFEVEASVNGGFMLHSDLISVVRAQVRGVGHLTQGFRLGLAVSSDIYTFPSMTGLNYTSEIGSLYLLNIMLAMDISLWEYNTSSPAILPDRLTADFGYGVGLCGSQYGGMAMSPGLMWHIAQYDNKSKISFSLNYRYQSFDENNYAGSVLVGFGYKF